MSTQKLIPDYDSKYDNYDIGQRLADLKSIVELQCSKGNYDVGDYYRGLANGLLLAWNIIREPYGKDVPYLDHQDQIKTSGAQEP